MFNKYKDIISGTFIFLLGLAYYLYSFTIPLTKIDTYAGSRLFPHIIAVILMAAGLILVIKDLVKLKKAKKLDTSNVSSNNFEEVSDEKKEKPLYYKTVLIFLIAFIYVWALEVVGFFVSTLIYLILQMIILTGKGQKKNYKLYILISLIATIIIQYMFTNLFSLILPRGIF